MVHFLGYIIRFNSTRW